MIVFILEAVHLLWQRFCKNLSFSFGRIKNRFIFASAIMQGRVAQLVQSTWFTPKGSGVRIPSRPL